MVLLLVISPSPILNVRHLESFHMYAASVVFFGCLSKHHHTMGSACARDTMEQDSNAITNNPHSEFQLPFDPWNLRIFSTSAYLKIHNLWVLSDRMRDLKEKNEIEKNAGETALQLVTEQDRKSQMEPPFLPAQHWDHRQQFVWDTHTHIQCWYCEMQITDQALIDKSYNTLKETGKSNRSEMCSCCWQTVPAKTARRDVKALYAEDRLGLRSAFFLRIIVRNALPPFWNNRKWSDHLISKLAS